MPENEWMWERVVARSGRRRQAPGYDDAPDLITSCSRELMDSVDFLTFFCTILLVFWSLAASNLRLMNDPGQTTQGKPC